MKLTDIKVGQEVALRKGKDAATYEVLGFAGMLVCIKEVGNRDYAPQMVDYSLVQRIVKQ